MIYFDTPALVKKPAPRHGSCVPSCQPVADALCNSDLTVMPMAAQLHRFAQLVFVGRRQSYPNPLDVQKRLLLLDPSGC